MYVKKFISFCQALKICTQKKTGSFCCLTVYMCYTKSKFFLSGITHVGGWAYRRSLQQNTCSIVIEFRIKWMNNTRIRIPALAASPLASCRVSSDEVNTIVAKDTFGHRRWLLLTGIVLYSTVQVLVSHFIMTLGGTAVELYIRWQWRNLVLYLCQLIFAAIL